MRPLALLLISILGLGCVAAASARAVPELDRAAISSVQCTPPGSGAKQVVDVSFVLTNYADSGYADQWAIDTVHRHLSIWKHSDGTFCAQIQDNGSHFVTRAGPSPTGISYIPSGITGTFDGGYVTLDIVGKFRPSYPTHGNLGTFDAKCDPNFDCPGPRPSWTTYFKPGVAADTFAHWGWEYDAGKNGTWLDQEDVVPPYGGDIRQF